MTARGVADVDGLPALGEELTALLRADHAAPSHEAGGGPTLVGVSLPTGTIDPISLFAAAAEAELEAALWLRPSEGTALVGIGRAWAVDGEGPERFREAETAYRHLMAGARLIARTVGGGNENGRDRDGSPDGARGRGPLLLGGFGFSGRQPDPSDPWAPFGAASMVLPSLLLSTNPAGSTITGSVLAGEAGRREAHQLEMRWERLLGRAHAIEPAPRGMVARPVVARLAMEHGQPGHDAWKRLVGMFAGAVGRGRIDKVVLARRVDLRSPVELDVPNALRRLAASAPESSIYAFRRGGRTFLGATPEQLVRTEGRAFRTVAVAGTTRRGADAAEDALLATELMTSEKDREEQQVVVAGMTALLAPIAETLEIAPRPSVMRLRFAQHLVTEISGTLPNGHGLLSVAAVLHPTPAVGGEPRATALALMDEHEGFDRGWYAGPIGWLGADGDGELCVALRCGIVDRTRASLFVGCGIVADSDPDAEWEESRLKLRAVISALGIPEDEP